MSSVVPIHYTRTGDSVTVCGRLAALTTDSWDDVNCSLCNLVRDTQITGARRAGDSMIFRDPETLDYVVWRTNGSQQVHGRFGHAVYERSAARLREQAQASLERAVELEQVALLMRQNGE